MSMCPVVVSFVKLFPFQHNSLIRGDRVQRLYNMFLHTLNGHFQYCGYIGENNSIMKKYLLLFVAITVLGTSCATLGALGLKPTTLETVLALRNILDSSTFKALKTLKSLNDNGVTGILPAELKPVLNTMKTLGLGKDIDKVTGQITKISAVALSEGEGIMSDAIKEVKFTDAVAVVLGGEDAATAILRKAMYGAVKKRYTSRINSQLEGTEAAQYWPLATGAYNMFSKNKINSSLSDFMAERAVDAIFLAMGKEEKKIRTDYKSLGNQVVTKVFDYYVGGKK